MTRTSPFLGETTDRNEAGLDTLRSITIKQRENGRVHRYTRVNMPRELRCANPQCQQGGLDLQMIVINWPSMQETFSCNGHEGSPKGRRIGHPCMNGFEVTLVKD